jgi:hypothetical protein
MRWAVTIARIGEKRNTLGILVGKYEGKKPMGRPRLCGRILLKRILER